MVWVADRGFASAANRASNAPTDIHCPCTPTVQRVCTRAIGQPELATRSRP